MGDRGNSRRRSEDEENGRNGDSSAREYQRLKQKQQWETSGRNPVPKKRGR